MLAVFMVTNLDDAPVAAAGDAPGTLRQAIFDANELPGVDTIEFAADLAGTIQLSHGELLITDALTIQGLGADQLTIDASGNDPTPDVADGMGSRIFHIDDGDFDVDSPVTIVGLTLTGGDVDGEGGAIHSRESLTVIDLVMTGNAATADGGGFYARLGSETVTIADSTISDNLSGGDGGGVFALAETGAATVTGSTISANGAADDGGGIFAATLSGAVSITHSTIAGNDAGDGGGGINVSALSGSAIITASTVAENQSAGEGGGIFSLTRFGGTTTVSNSTISANGAADDGGGILLQTDDESATAIVHSTVTGNTADIDSSGSGSGGGVVHKGDGDLTIGHTIVAGNADLSGVAPDLSIPAGSTISFSLVGDNTGSGLVEAPVGEPDVDGNLIGDPTGDGAIDPLLGPLANNGGATRTHALLAASPAVDAGDPAATAGEDGVPEFDQRGETFVRVFDGNEDGTARIDIGAYERQLIDDLDLMLVVSTLDDVVDGDFSPGNLSLREAVGLANGSLGPNTITFSEILFEDGPATIQLALGEIGITEELTILGPGAELLTIVGGSRILNITAPTGDFEFAGLTLTGGSTTGDNVDADDTTYSGGAIRSLSSGNLSIVDSVVTGNSTAGLYAAGGGIFALGNVTLTDSTVSENVTMGDFAAGGGLHAASLSITHSTIHGNRTEGMAASGGGLALISDTDASSIFASTISGNSAMGDGGGIFSNTAAEIPLTITNSTISGNQAGSVGGGLFNYDGLTIVEFSTITDNTAPDGGGSGVASYGDALTLTQVRSSIIAGNTNSDVDFVAEDVNSFESLGYNLIGTGNALTAFVNNDQTGILDPGLEPLADNGGPTLTHALLSDSPAVDAGDPTATAGEDSVPEFDQRGEFFFRVLDGIGDGIPRIDIGAFEAPRVIPMEPQIGLWGAGRAILDTNRNFVLDIGPGGDSTVFLGHGSDYVFTGNFVNPELVDSIDGFDKLAAYGRVGNQWRWLIDHTGDGQFEVVPLAEGVNGIPVAGNFGGAGHAGHQVGVFTGSAWHFDTTGDFQPDLVVSTNYAGYPIVGDFNNNGLLDVMTYVPSQNVFYVDLGREHADGRINIDGEWNYTIRIGPPASPHGFPSVRERPVAADMNGDGIMDIGIWLPDNTFSGDQAEWFFFLSGDEESFWDRIDFDENNQGVLSFRPFDDLHAQYGGRHGIPLVGNFERPPPVTLPVAASSGGGLATAISPVPLSAATSLVSPATIKAGVLAPSAATAHIASAASQTVTKKSPAEAPPIDQTVLAEPAASTDATSSTPPETTWADHRQAEDEPGLLPADKSTGAAKTPAAPPAEGTAVEGISKSSSKASANTSSGSSSPSSPIDETDVPTNLDPAVEPARVEQSPTFVESHVRATPEDVVSSLVISVAIPVVGKSAADASEPVTASGSPVVIAAAEPVHTVPADGAGTTAKLSKSAKATATTSLPPAAADAAIEQWSPTTAPKSLKSAPATAKLAGIGAADDLAQELALATVAQSAKKK